MLNRVTAPLSPTSNKNGAEDSITFPPAGSTFETQLAERADNHVVLSVETRRRAAWTTPITRGRSPTLSILAESARASTFSP